MKPVNSAILAILSSSRGFLLPVRLLPDGKVECGIRDCQFKLQILLLQAA